MMTAAHSLSREVAGWQGSHAVQQACAHYFAFHIRGLREGGAVLPSFPNETLGLRPHGQVAKLQQASAWCVEII
jgi:hypothetical protein